MKCFLFVFLYICELKILFKMRKFAVILFLLCVCFTNMWTVTAQNEVRTCTATAPALSTERNTSWLSWASNTPTYHMMSLTNPTPYYAIQRFTTSDLANYNGMQLTKVSFLPSNVASEPTVATYTVIVYTGGYYSGSYTSNSPGTQVAFQQLSSVTYGEWNTITLNSPVTINSSQELWIAIYVNASQGYAMSHDDATPVNGKGNLMGYNGYWGLPDDFLSGADINNWNIAGCVTDGVEEQFIDLSVKFINNGTQQNEITNLNVNAGQPLRPIIVVHNNNSYQASLDYTDTVFIHGTMDGVPFSTHTLASDTLESGRGVWLSVLEMSAADLFTNGYLGTTHTLCYEISTPAGWHDADLSNNSACVTVSFADYSQYYHITVVNQDGTVSPDGDVSIYPGGSQRFVITPPDSMIIDRLLVDGVDRTSDVHNLLGVGKVYTFTNVQSDHTLHVFYRLDDTGFDEPSRNAVAVYPNPACDGRINIEADVNIRQVVVYNMWGRALQKFSFSNVPHQCNAWELTTSSVMRPAGQQVSIDLTGFRGTFILEVVTDAGVFSKKIILQ